MTDKIKIKVSYFVSYILDNDAIRFGFMKNNQSNKNALLNKLIPILFEVRKSRRDEIERILKDEYNRNDAENIYNAVNTVIDKVYFDSEGLGRLVEDIWIRPSKETHPCFDEIENSETRITAQEVSTYIRSLLNEYVRLPQYKREMLTFDKELDLYSYACYTHQIVHFKNKETNEKFRVFLFDYCYGALDDQTNYFVFYDIANKRICTIKLYNVADIYVVKQKYKPSAHLIEMLQKYFDDENYEQIIEVEDE